MVQYHPSWILVIYRGYVPQLLKDSNAFSTHPTQRHPLLQEVWTLLYHLCELCISVSHKLNKKAAVIRHCDML